MSTIRHILDFFKTKSTGRVWAVSPGIAFLERSRLVAFLIFLVTVGVILLISYQGIRTAELPVLPGQIATVNVHASASFDYESTERTRILEDNVRDRTPPVYRIDNSPLELFQTNIRELLVSLEKVEAEHPLPESTPGQRKKALLSVVEAFNRRGPYKVNVDDLLVLMQQSHAKDRAVQVERSLVVLRDIYRDGMQDASLGSTQGGLGSVTVFQVLSGEGQIIQRPVLSLEEALILLRVNIAAEGMKRDLAMVLFRIFRNGLQPNLVFDKAATLLREKEAIKNIKPVLVHVDRGQLIIESGTRVSAEQHEMLMAHRRFLANNDAEGADEGLHLLGRVLMVLAMVAACLMYIHLEDPETLRSNSRIGLLALVLMVNLALVRLTYALLGMDFFIEDQSWAATLPYFAPTALAPLIVAILIDVGSGMFMALFVSLFTGVIYGNRFDVQVLTFLASIVAIHGCRAIRKRSRIVSAATVGAFVLSVSTLLMGLVAQTPPSLLLRQTLAGLLTGTITGIAVVGLLPVLEALFKRTTDITFLELTDSNHPLLRTMQLEAPGTYHHSLVVAQLSENAAASIGANSVLARVCALYHDIGKTLRPQYFSENQTNGRNPHDALPPLESARIIRDHVNEGLTLAHEHKLPLAVREVIQQHHGRSLIRFFYVKARQAAGLSGTRPPVDSESAQADSVNIEDYRHNGELPNFKESAIISLADCVEAASRSIKRLTPESLHQLIDTLVADRMAEGQLDQAPLTLGEIARIKDSFCGTLLNMLHSRVEYPELEAPPPPPDKPVG